MSGQLTFAGELTIASSEELVSNLLDALQGQQPLHVDLSAVERIDTAAAQVLVAAKQQALRSSTTITFSCSAAVFERLRTLGMQL